MKQIAEIFIITIIAELVAVFLLTLLGSFFSKKGRWIITSIFGRLLDIDVEHVYRNKRQADEDLREELRRASFVDLLTGRGNELQRETFSEILSPGSTGKGPAFRILLPVTVLQTDEPDWTRQREEEVAAFDSAFGDGILREQIDTTANFLSRYAQEGRIELRRFNYPHIGRILITDRVAYFTPYRSDVHGRDSHVIKYRRGGEMYDFFQRLFNQLWNVAGKGVHSA
jgi:hypothetical protein